MNVCFEIAEVRAGGLGSETILMCCLNADHEGLHFDDAENISWKAGRS